MPPPAGSAVVARDLWKRFGPTAALSGLDLSVPEGTVCGLLGPNGAGKTTAVRIFATLLRPDGGQAWVAGHDVTRDPGLVRTMIGLAGQHAAVDEKLSARDNLRMFGRLHHLSDRVARRRAEELLERFGLAEATGRTAGTFSGGMRRRLDLIAALMVAPPVLFLDEPTTGLDPRGRNEIWDTVRDLVRDGTTVVLTTQYLDEADQLADRVVVIDHGRAIADGTPGDLKAAIGSRLDVVVRDGSSLAGAATVLERVTGTPAQSRPEDRLVSVASRDGALTLTAVLRELDRVGVSAEDIAIRRPTLDEVFLRLTAAPDVDHPGGGLGVPTVPTTGRSHQ